MFSWSNTVHEMKWKMGHKWLGHSHLAPVPVMLIQVGHHMKAGT